MKKIVVLLGLISLASCTSNTIYEKPKNLIPKDTMTLLLTDLFIASSAYFSKNTHSEKKANYMPLIYDKYKIDSLRFTKSNFYYMTKIDEYDELYKEVKINLTNLKNQFEKPVDSSFIPNKNSYQSYK